MLDVARTRSGSRARRLWLECRWSFPSASKTPPYLEFTGQSARQARLALVGFGDKCFNTLFLLYSIPSMNGTSKAHIAGNQSVVMREKEARRHQRLSRDGSLLVGFAF